MTKRNAAPTFGWVIVSHFYKWVTWLFLILIFLVGFQVFVIYKQLERDCSNVYKREVNVASYWLHIDVGSTRAECPRHEP